MPRERRSDVSHFCGTFSDSRAEGLALAAQQEYEQDVEERMTGGGTQPVVEPGSVSQPLCQAFEPGAFWSFED
jgi:hypothetical protein